MTYLVVYATIVGGDIVGVEKEAFLYCWLRQLRELPRPEFTEVELRVRLLKLVTGVEISTRPPRSSGSEGKAVKSNSLRAAAAAKREAFRRSIAMI